MSRIQHFAAVVAAGLSFGITANAFAVPLISNLPPGAATATSQINGSVHKAVGFTPNENLILVDAQLYLSGFDGASDNPVIQIVQGASPTNGDNTLFADLTTFSQDNEELPSVVEQVFTFTADDEPIFEAGLPYWLVASVGGDDPTVSYSWSTTFPLQTPVGDLASFDGYQFSTDGSDSYAESGEFNNFAINVRALDDGGDEPIVVSEPTGLATLGVAALLAAGFSRRQRR